MLNQKPGQRRTAAPIGKAPSTFVTGGAVAGEQLGRTLTLVDIGLGDRRHRGQGREQPNHGHDALERPNPC